MRLQFVDCVLDTRARQLERRGEMVPLEPKMYELLETLIKRRDTVVTNSELDEILWPNVYVARTSLTRLVSELRSVLGDEARESHIIRTVYKTGYSFCAPVTVVTPRGYSPAVIELVWKKQLFALTDGEHIAGRDPECSVIIDANTVSRRHARITVLSKTATVEDLESKNGTHVNGVRITTPTRLQIGCELALGTEVLRLRGRNPSTVTVRVDSDQNDSNSAKKR
jgi:DNA-binding winged helix-turn-helix (wHTH) protein